MDPTSQGGEDSRGRTDRSDVEAAPAHLHAQQVGHRVHLVPADHRGGVLPRADPSPDEPDRPGADLRHHLERAALVASLARYRQFGLRRAGPHLLRRRVLADPGLRSRFHHHRGRHRLRHDLGLRRWRDRHDHDAHHRRVPLDPLHLLVDHPDRDLQPLHGVPDLHHRLHVVVGQRSHHQK